MRWFRHSLRIVAMVATVLLVSCIDGREEVWLHADGSGRAEVSYSLPAAAARFQGGEAGIRQKINDLLKKTTALHSTSCDVSTQEDRLQIRVRASFDSALDLKKLAKSGSISKLPSSASHMAGKVKVGLSGRTVDFSRTITAGGALPGAKFLPASQFADRKLTYIIHLPLAASESDATRTEDGGRTLVWDFPLAEAVHAPVITHFKVKIPIPVWLVVAVVGVVSAVGFVGYRLVRKWRGARPT